MFDMNKVMTWALPKLVALAAGPKFKVIVPILAQRATILRRIDHLQAQATPEPEAAEKEVAELPEQSGLAGAEPDTVIVDDLEAEESAVEFTQDEDANCLDEAPVAE